jgi:ABC-2 type transport system permease protein
MDIKIPSTSTVLRALIRADFTTQWRNRRSFILILVVPVVILFTWGGIIKERGSSFVLSNCITVGLMAIGLMGYSNTIARDRDKGIFQRLRVAPLPNWAIMASRLSIQIAMITLVNLIVFVAGYYIHHVTISPGGYALTLATAFAGGAVYLGLGQVIVGLIKNPETMNSTTRLVYFLFILVGMFGQFGVLGKELQQVVLWSPFGTVEQILSSSMHPATWTRDSSIAFLSTVLYAIVFFAVGIKRFQWSSR